MEGSFRVRVDKAFGSLASSSSHTLSSSSSLSSLWCLNDEEIERREWKRETDSPDDAQPKPYPPSLDGLFANHSQLHLSSQKKPLDFRTQLEADLKDLDDDDGENNDNDDDVRKPRRQLVKPDDHDDEEWDIRSSIGLDCTLDYEEEEDEYDKVAIGREKTGDRIYMKDISGSGADDINFYDDLPNTFQDITRDPRANHIAAKLRLKEDAEAAGELDSLRVSRYGSCSGRTQNNASEECVNLKSILKRKENQTDPNLQKRVRFHSQCKNDWEEECGGVKNEMMENCSTAESKTSEASFLHQQCSGVPDYIRNPSKYTHYTFDSSTDVDEESNQQTCLDFLNQLKSSNNNEGQAGEADIDLPKSITFTPKKRPGKNFAVTSDNEMDKSQVDVGRDFMPKRGWAIGIAAGETREAKEDGEVCAMEEDDPEETTTPQNSSLRRQGRQYRTKASVESIDSVN